MDRLAHAEESAAQELVPWDSRSRNYKAVHTRGGRIAQIGFIPNDGHHDLFLPLADLRLIRPTKDGRELILEFSNFIVVGHGRNLRYIAADIAIGRVAALEAFDAARRDSPTPNDPFIESLRFYLPEQQGATGDRASQSNPAQRLHLV